MDWGDSFWAAMALVLVIEGALPFVSPAGWRRVFSQMIQLRDGQIRFCALLCIVVGISILLLV